MDEDEDGTGVLLERGGDGGHGAGLGGRDGDGSESAELIKGVDVGEWRPRRAGKSRA